MSTDIEFEPEINATVIENNENIILNLSQHNNQTSSSKTKLLSEKVNKTAAENFTLRNIDAKKIQSNTKDIVEDDGDNLMLNSHRKIVPATSTPIPRTTLPNIYSNSGGNAGNIDNVQILSMEGSNRKRHRNRRQNKQKSNVTVQNIKDNYEAKVARLRHELTRPSESPPEKQIKPKQLEKRTKKIKKKTSELKLADIFATQQDATVDLSSSVHHRVTRAATAKKDRIWDFGVIPYEIDANFSGAHKALFKQGKLLLFICSKNSK